MLHLFHKIMHAMIILLILSPSMVCIYAQTNLIGLQNEVRFDEKTKLPAALYNVNSRQYSGTPEEVAREYLLENKLLFKLKDNLDDLKITEVKDSPAGRHVGFIQNYKGIPVMRSEIVVSINRQNRISMVVNGYKPNISINTIPSIVKNQAILLAKQAIGAVNSKEVSPSKAELMVYEDSVNTFHLVWKFFIFPLEQGGEWLVVVDAHNGEILEKFNALFDYVNGKGRVFDPDPGTYLNDATLTDQNDADYAAIQPAYKDNVTLNDLNDSTIYGLYYVRGRYAWSMDVRLPYDAVSTAVHPDSFRYKRNQNGFEEVNVYYFVDKQRRYIGSLGFNPTWKYLGSGSQTMAFDARGYDPWAGERNAVYYPVEEYMIFGVPASYVDAGEDQSVILHEYGHAFHDALMYGGTDAASSGSDTRGISEGLAEYLGISYRRTTQSNPFRPNHRSIWFYPTAGESILSASSAKYPAPPNGNWGSSPYEKMNVWASTMMEIEYNTATDPSAGVRLGRDMTTTLLLTSLNYVTSSSNAIDNVNAIFQADRDIYNGSHLSTLATVFYNRGFFYNNEVSGTIASNTTWSGNKYVTGNVTVNSGVTLTISQNTFLFFASGTSLTVNGTLTANGTSVNHITFDRSGTTGTWGSIKFDGTGASSSILNNVEVFNSTNIQILNDANIIVENSKIQDCTQGIYIYNSSPQILNNQILNPSQHGIYIDASGKTPLILNNTITKTSANLNYKHQEGIILYNGTIGYIAHNSISGFDHGIYVGGGSNAYFTNYSWQNYYLNNRFTGNRYGIMVGWGGYLNAGSGTNYCWNNSISSNDYYNIYVYRSSTAWAQNNYWGSGDPKQYVDGAPSFLKTLPALSSDPWGYQNAVKAFTPTDAVIAEAQLITTSAKSVPAISDLSKSKVLSPQTQAAELNNDLGAEKDEDELMKGILLEQEGKIDEAIEQLKKVVKDKKYGLYAITELAGIKARYGKENIQPYFEDLLKDPNTGNKSRIKKSLAVFYLSKDEDDRATAIFDELKDDKRSKKDNFEGLYEKFNFMLHKKKDVVSAKNLLTELKNKFADDEEAMMHIATSDMLISESNNFALGKKQNVNESSIETEVPKEYELSNNYPNPFNPVTTINYQLPKSGNVMLKIFDILGNEVKTLVNEQKEMGKYTVQFDASSLASGMYVYQLRVNDYTSTKKMLLLK